MIHLKIIRELQHFETECHIYTSYVNNLHIFPQKVHNIKNKGEIQLSIKLMEIDDISAEGLPSIMEVFFKKNFSLKENQLFYRIKCHFSRNLKLNFRQCYLRIIIYYLSLSTWILKKEIIGYGFGSLIKNSKLRLDV